MNLYELSATFRQLQDMVDNDEVEFESIKGIIESYEISIEEKLENISKLIKNTEGKIDAFKKEEKRLSDRRKTMENKVKWLKEYMLTSLELTNRAKVEAGLFTIRKQKNPDNIVIKDQSHIRIQ